LGDSSSLLSLSLDIAERIPDVSNRLYAFLRVSDAYFKAGREVQGAEVLKRTGDRIATLTDESRKIQLDIEIIRIALGNHETSFVAKLLPEVLARVLAIKDQAVRGAQLATLIQVCFINVQDASEILRQAVQNIYILDDPSLRVNLLTDLVVAYTRSGAGKRSVVLLQQAIPAASAIVNPFRKAEALSRIAYGFYVEGQTEDAAHYAHVALSTLQEQEILSLTLSDARSIQQVIVQLIQIGMIPDASALISYIPYLQERLISQAALVEGYFAINQAFQARLTVQRILNSLDQNNENTTEKNNAIILKIQYLARFAMMALEKNQGYANAWLDESLRLLKTVPSESVPDGLKAELYRDCILFDRAKAGQSVLLSIRDGYVEANALIELSMNNALNQEVAKDVARQALAKARNAGYLTESLMARAVVQVAKAGYLQDLASVMQSVNDPYVCAMSLIDLSDVFPPDVEMPPSAAKMRVQLSQKWK